MITLYSLYTHHFLILNMDEGQLASKVQQTVEKKIKLRFCYTFMAFHYFAIYWDFRHRMQIF